MKEAPDVGSSRSSAAGRVSFTSSQAILTLFSCPPEIFADAFSPPADD